MESLKERLLKRSNSGKLREKKHKLKKAVFGVPNIKAFSNFWIWNLIFFNLAIVVILFFFIQSYEKALPEIVGVNLDSLLAYDTLIPRIALYGVCLIHFGFALVTFMFGIRHNKKLNHLYILGFLNTIILASFEFIALKNLIEYFI